MMKKVETVRDWAARNNQPLVREVVEELAKQVQELEARSEISDDQVVATAMKSLSYSELVALKKIMPEVTGSEALVVASKIADACGITRSVIVNALRKLESAGVIRSRSLGMKGTRIEIIVPGIRKALAS